MYGIGIVVYDDLGSGSLNRNGHGLYQVTVEPVQQKRERFLTSTLFTHTF
jgi:hypothetical protein